MALYVSRRAFLEAKIVDMNMGINFGSSRGATELFEKYFEEFRNTQQVSTFTSPATTLGNIASWVAHDLQLQGPEISHSITCSTGLHAVLNGIAWLQAGFSQSFLVGASEAPLTPFTLAQLAALKVYSNYKDVFATHDSKDILYHICSHVFYLSALFEEYDFDKGVELMEKAEMECC